MARKKEVESAEERSEEEILDEGSGPRVYELGFHIDPELPTEEVKKTYQAVRSAIEASGAIVAEGEPLQVQLAYTISRQDTGGRRDFDSASFAWIAYEADSSKHGEILSSVKADPRIVRFIDLLTTKDAARHSAEMREMAMSAEGGSVSGGKMSETVSDAELDAAIEEAVPAII